MKLSELMNECDYATEIELHNARDGRLVANTPKSLKKYGTVEVIGFHPQLKMSSDGKLARPFLYVWGHSCDIQDVKEKEKGA